LTIICQLQYTNLVIEIRRTAEFTGWLTDLKDLKARSRILTRIDRLELGNSGDAKYFDGIGELRVDTGPGYRVYFVKRGTTVVILLCGGDKSTQASDIKKAIAMAKEVK
jgi:putative addiction module killer protein